jgi:hypothetical protein
LQLKSFVRSLGHIGRDERRNWRFAALLGALTTLLALHTASGAEPGGLLVELNKLEPQERACRAYVVVTNKTATAYQALKLDLILFQTDGVIGRRLAIDLGPLKPDKRTVKLFDLDATPCDQVGRFLINDVLEYKTESAPTTDCLASITPTSLTKAQLTK